MLLPVDSSVAKLELTRLCVFPRADDRRTLQTDTLRADTPGADTLHTDTLYGDTLYGDTLRSSLTHILFPTLIICKNTQQRTR